MATRLTKFTTIWFILDAEKIYFQLEKIYLLQNAVLRIHQLPYQEGKGQQKIIPQKNAEKINKFIKYFVEINKNEVNKNCRQKTKENV